MEYNIWDDDDEESVIFRSSKFLVRFLDMITSPNWNVLFAILVVLFCHYKGRDVWYSLMDHGLFPTVFDYGYAGVDILKGYYQMACELLRSIQGPAPTRLTSPPPLVVLNEEDTRAPSPSTSSTSNHSQGEVEPAFLNENDYPPGWLVYHGILGVVSKEEADEYDHRKEKSNR